MASILVVIVLAIGIVFVALWIGSVILRSAVGLTNKIMGGAAPSDLDLYDDPYRRYPQEPSGLAIPVPSTGRAIGILLVIGLVDLVVRLGIMMAAGAGSALRGGNVGMADLIALAVSAVVHIAMLSSLLPTSLGRAFVVLVFQVLIGLVIGLVIGGAAGVLIFGLMGTR